MIYLESDTVFTWKRLTDAISGNVITSAIVVGTLRDSCENELSTFDFVSQGNGDYVGILTAAAVSELEQGVDYFIDITATADGGTDTRRETHTADYRGYE